MSRARGILALLLALVAAESVYSWTRFRAVEERLRHEARAQLLKEVEKLASRLEYELESVEPLVRFAADLDSVRRLGAGPRDHAGREPAARECAALLMRFPYFGRICILDAASIELLRADRMGGGVAVIPDDLLADRAPDRWIAEARAAKAGAVSVSSLEIDANRVDVRADDRRMIRYATAAPGGLMIEISVYASALLGRLQGAQANASFSVALADLGGRTVAGALGDAEVARIAAALGPAANGPRAADSADGARAYFGAPTGPKNMQGAPEWMLIASAPASAVAAPGGAVDFEVIVMIALPLATLLIAWIASSTVARVDEERRRVAREQEAERKLVESERLAAIGRLTAGVAHEINNPLEGIRNYLALLAREDKDPAARREYVELVRHGFDRIGSIVKELLSFAHPPAPVKAPVDLMQVIERVERVTKHDAGFRNIRWTCRCDAPNAVVVGDPFALEQVVLNLALNSRDAMQRAAGGGQASGELRIIIEPDPEHRERLLLRFEDDGPGIPADVLPKIFEPFFSTRPQGTGLGLSVTASVVRAHGGSIRAGNRPEGGAVMRIELPQYQQPPVTTRF